jgi:hypothetical protein
MHLPSFGRRRHSSIVKGFVSKTEITLVATPVDKRKTFQEFWVGKGEKALYTGAKSVPVRHSQVGLLPKEREGMSVVRFFVPGDVEGSEW